LTPFCANLNVPAHGKTTEELVAERLGLGDGRKTAVLDLLGVELERVLGELETLLDESLELADAATLVAEDLLGVGGTDDDLSAGVGDADLTAGVTLLSELASAVGLVKKFHLFLPTGDDSATKNERRGGDSQWEVGIKSPPL
jgi:hypothetical protein